MVSTKPGRKNTKKMFVLPWRSEDFAMGEGFRMTSHLIIRCIQERIQKVLVDSVILNLVEC